MRFMMIVKSSAESESGALPGHELLEEMGRFNAEMTRAGVMLAGEGVHASEKGVRVRTAGKSLSVIDGPFAETKELVAGYWLIQVKSREEAIAWAKRVPFSDGEIELRLLYELEDFPVDPAEAAAGADGWRDQEKRMREELAAPGPAGPARKPGTTRFLVMLKSDAQTEGGTPPSHEMVTAMGGLMDEMAASGSLLGGEGLKPTASGARVRFSGGTRTVVDGPFSESKELIAGFSLIQVASRDEAIAFAKRWLAIHADGGGEIEIRPLHELSDFPVDPAERPDGWRAQAAGR